MSPLVTQLLVPPPQADPHQPGPQPLEVWVPVKISSLSCGCGQQSATAPAGTPASNTATYASANYYYATCQATDAVGSLVYATGEDDEVTSADCSSPLPVIGIIITKRSSTACTVQTYGIVAGIYRSLLANTQYFLGHMGQIVAPPFDDTVQFVQGIGSAIDSMTLYLRLSGSAVRRDTTS